MSINLQPGDIYAGELQILEILGEGTFARVYKVKVPGYDQPLALKLSREPLVRKDECQRALREIAVMRSLTNPHIARTYDSGQRPDGSMYILMDYLCGRTLDQWHDFAKPLHPAQAVTIIHQVCLGLAEAHQRGIVHRDIKPENIFIEDSGTVKVLDFGLARSWDDSPIVGVNATTEHLLIGTPHFCQPEQLKTRTLTPASDVYSLGLILYELLCARSPYHPHESIPAVKKRLLHNPAHWLHAHANIDITPLMEHKGCEELPPTLAEAVERTLFKLPANRPPHAGALANILGHILHRDMGIPVAALLKILHPDQTMEQRAFVPGCHLIGSGPRCQIMLRDDSVAQAHAILEWSGMPLLPRIRPLVKDGSILVNDDIVLESTELGPEDEISIGGFRIAVVL